MSHRIPCSCGRSLLVRAHQLGKRLKCPHCGARHRLGSRTQSLPDRADSSSSSAHSVDTTYRPPSADGGELKPAPPESSIRRSILDESIPEPEAEPADKRMPVAAYFAIAGAIVVGALWNAIAAFLWNRSERFGIDAFVDPYVQLAIAPTVICYGAAVGIGMRRYIPDQSLALALYASGARIYLTTLIITLVFSHWNGSGRIGRRLPVVWTCGRVPGRNVLPAQAVLAARQIEVPLKAPDRRQSNASIVSFVAPALRSGKRRRACRFAAVAVVRIAATRRRQRCRRNRFIESAV